MRTLFVYPEFPKTFWSYEKILELVNRKVLLPPLGLVTVAALLPQEWEMKLVDRNVREVSEAEWEWAELVADRQGQGSGPTSGRRGSLCQLDT
jgi:radical SAM superfamily enzyme YgiQ (UPF0313 family)